MGFDYENAYQIVRDYLGKNQGSLAQALNEEKDKGKHSSLLSEIFFANLLNKTCGHGDKIIKQKGENHPDISMKIKGKRVNFEITLITSQDNRFNRDVVNTHDHIVTDKVKTQLTSEILDKTKQYSRWINKGIVKKNDVNIIVVDLGIIMPCTPVATLLDAAVYTLDDSFEAYIDEDKVPSVEYSLPRSRGYLFKEGKEIILDEFYSSLRHIDALITFTKVNVIESTNNIDIININNNKIVNYLFNNIKPYYQTSIGSWGILWGEP